MSQALLLQFAETLSTNQQDGFALVNRPVQAELFDRLIQNDKFSSFPGLFIVEQLVQSDAVNFVKTAAGAGTVIQILISQTMVQSDAIVVAMPIARLTQMTREVVNRPINSVTRLTQLARETIYQPQTVVVRLTQLAREVIFLTPEAFLAQEDYLMSITDQLFQQDTLIGQNSGLFFLTIGESNQPGMFDQSGQDNIKVKKNQVIKANNLQTADTSLNHWLDRFSFNFTPGSFFQSFSDTLTLSDAFTDKLPVALTEQLSDQTPGLSDAYTALAPLMLSFIQTLNLWQEFFAQPYLGVFAESNADQWQDSLAGLMAYFMPLSDVMALTDSFTLPLWQVSSDTLTMADGLGVGYGQGVVEALNLSDSNFLGYGDQISEQLVLSEQLILGYGQGNVDSLTLLDAMGVSYGDIVSDQLVASDSIALLEGLIELLSDDEGPNWADAFAFSGGVNPYSDQLVLSDSFTLGYGNFLPDQLIMSDSEKLLFGIGLNVFEQVVLSDQLGQFPGLFIVEQLQQQDAVQFPVWLVLADQLAQADSVGAGYGSKVTDSTNLADSMNLVESFETMLADATPTMLENLQQLFNYLLAIEDGQTMVEQLNLMYGLLIDGQFLEFDDEINVVGVVLPFLSDDMSQNWLDAILTELVFAPSEIVVRDFKVLAQILASVLDTVQEQQADSFKSQGEQQATFDVLLDGEV
jgi:hypothetical protein